MQQTNVSRRDALRAGLAAGVSLILPAAMLGCDRKDSAMPRDTGPTGESAPSAPSVSPAPSPPTAPTGKASQASVQYQAQPQGEQKCSNCLHFIAASNTCVVVEGQISPEGWCSIWVKAA
jgi:hypothetical protein